MEPRRERKPYVFGVRHLSPAGAYHLRSFLDERKPKCILVEGPSDFTALISDLTGAKVKPPVAVMAYTSQTPILSILYPFAVYSPEYQALLWAREQGCDCRFMDLPSSVFLALQDWKERKKQELLVNGDGMLPEEENSLPKTGLFEKTDRETFWEYVLERCESPEAYRSGAAEFGRNLRLFTEKQREAQNEDSQQSNKGSVSINRMEENMEAAETVLREAYMRRQIAEVLQSGVLPEELVVVTGAYHVDGLLQGEPMTDEELEALPKLQAEKTLMPYSYYRLSSHSGYGAGNRAPAYYELVWESLQREKPDYSAKAYLIQLAAYQRKQGNPVSSAEVIEAVRLAGALAQLQGYHIPALCDLRDAAVTCMGHGQLSEISLAVADTEIGSKIGALPDGVSRTSIQADFYQKLEELRLTQYRSMTTQELSLDLREKLTVKSEKLAFLDLERSFFLHKLCVLGVSFAKIQPNTQEKATWAEKWLLSWTPEAEIQIVEAVLKGDTLEQATSFVLREKVEKERSIEAAAKVVEEAFFCGLPAAVRYATRVLQEIAVDAASVTELAKTATSLSVVVQYGDIRHLDAKPLLPILAQLFLRACLIFPESCVCDDAAAKEIAKAMEEMNAVVLKQEGLSEERWLRVLSEIAKRDDLNTKLSGFAAAILLERGEMDGEELGCEVERRLSRGIPAELGAGWFEGLALKNHYALLARMTLWEKLSDYLDTLDEEEFKRALVFLRRAFADFSVAEKSDIAENLGEIWQINPQQVSEVLLETLSKEQEEELLAGLDDFDFDSI
ncbi:MAG: DUF5682 family protein [bacterium]|nr:DUF5682 family protein [bacterium]